MRRVSAIVPAAGLSRRFGGPNKLLQPYGESTVIGAVVRCLVGCGLPVVVVTGRDADEVARAASPAISVHNPRYEERPPDLPEGQRLEASETHRLEGDATSDGVRFGLGSSIAAGITGLEAAEGYLIALGDMPGIRPAVIEALLLAFETAGEHAILAPVYASEPGRPGHPVLFSAAHRPALERLSGDEGARSIMHANRVHLRLVPVEGALPDIDRPADLS